jgi:hypothetical protein
MDPALFTLLDGQARLMVEPAWDAPERRYEIREAFYKRFGFGENSSYGYGNSELAFIRWEINRGVLNPLYDAKQPGSEWWKIVNWHFLYHGTLAVLLYDRNIQPEEVINNPSSLWLKYMYQPTGQAWYAAHNATITHGYYVGIDPAFYETKSEQRFMRQVLMRLYFAQAMVMGQSYSFGRLGKFLANPNDNCVEEMVHIPDFYPDHYPLSQMDILRIRYKEFSLIDWIVEIFDKDIIGPNMKVMFHSVADWIEFPFVRTFVSEKKKLIYPKTTEPSNFAVS